MDTRPAPSAELLEEQLRFHPFLRGLDERSVRTLAECAEAVRFEADQAIFEAGRPADRVYLIRTGTVAVEVQEEGRSPRLIQTLREGELLGWSWLFPPHRWTFGARASTLTQALALDAECLRHRFEADRELGYRFLLRVAEVMAERLESARRQVSELSRSRT